MSRVIIFFGLLLVLITSCVQNKQLVYLQDEEELNKTYLNDSVVRKFDLPQFEYKIQPEDILSIRFNSLTEEEFDVFSKQQDNTVQGNQINSALNGYLVDEEGNIELPIVGEIHVSGYTLDEIESKLVNVIKDYVSNPSIRVRLLNYRVTVLGEVSKEGVVDLTNNRATIMEVIGRAGGLSDLANREQVKLIRQLDGEYHVIYLNLLDESLVASSYFYAHNNDIIIVEPLKQRPFRKYFGPNLSLVISSISVLLLTINLLR